MDSVYCLSPLDGRYLSDTRALRDFFSEFALFKYRALVEIEYLINFIDFNTDIVLSDIDKKDLQNIYKNITKDDILDIKNYEKRTNHDIKALEYFLRDKIEKIFINNKTKIIPLVHIGLTSQDINNPATILMIKDSINNIFIQDIKLLIRTIKENEWKDIWLLGMTHGQPASPTSLGKEFLVFAERLENQLKLLENIEYRTKFGGATGNMNSLYFAYPNKDWISFSNMFTKSIGLTRHQYTTQIDHYDNYSEVFDVIKRISTILIDMCQDIWLYISRNVFKLKVVEGETGSSAMPHKVNPIDFENAEANFMITVNWMEFFTRNLPVSKMQRDLKDSTITRNFGVGMGHFCIAIKKLLNGLKKITPNIEYIQNELNDNIIVVSEAIQVYLRSIGIKNGYELVKDLTRNSNKITLKDFKNMIYQLNISDKDKEKLVNIEFNQFMGFL